MTENILYMIVGFAFGYFLFCLIEYSNDEWWDIQDGFERIKKWIKKKKKKKK